MKIAHFVFNLQISGRDIMIVNIANEQAKYEDVALFILDNLVDESMHALISERCKVYRLNREAQCKNPLKLVPIILRLNYLMLRYSPDIIHVHIGRITWPLCWPWPIVRTKHENNKPITEYWRLKALYAVSNAVKDNLAQNGYKSTVVLNGIRTKSYQIKEERKKSDQLHVAQVGRLFVSEKGQDIALEAIHILKRRGVANFVMHFIGAGASETMLKEKVLEYGLDNIVVFEGEKTQEYLYQHLCDYDLLLQPSRTEAYGLTVAEAMAAKVPVLVSNIPALMEVIGSGELGMFFQSENAEDLADKLQSFMEGNNDLSVVEKAHTFACQEYDISRTAEKYIQEYKKVLKKNK